MNEGTVPGEAADASEADRKVTVVASDEFHFDPASIEGSSLSSFSCQTPRDHGRNIRVRMTVKRLFATALLLLGSVPFLGTAARASCIAPPPIPKAIRQAPAVFVGTVVEVTNMRRWVTVEVSDVWKGDVEDLVEVRAGPKDPPGPGGVATSVDRHYRLGETYFFVPYKATGPIFRDTNCSRTTRYEPALDRFKPASAQTPSPSETEREPSSQEESDGGSLVWWLAGALVALFGAGLLLRSRRNV
jgi:hypothetical protein